MIQSPEQIEVFFCFDVSKQCNLQFVNAIWIEGWWIGKKKAKKNSEADNWIFKVRERTEY